MRRILPVILLIVVMAGCREVSVPGTDETEPILVVEGVFTSMPGQHEVKLSYTCSFNERPYFPYEENAIVEIEDEDGNIIPFYHVGFSLYRSDSNDTCYAEPGKTYVLRIITPDGEVYESWPQTVLESPEISELECRLDHEMVLVENINGDYREVNYNGIQIMSGTKGSLPAKNYYLYRWIAYEQHLFVVVGPGGSVYLYSHRKLNGKYTNIIRTGNADEFSDFEIRDHNMVFIPTVYLTDYNPLLLEPPSFTRFQGLIYKLEQWSLSDNAYLFWRDAELQLAAGGRLFDPVAPRLKGNIRCVSDST
ncbi:MAG: DUF4249 domain-containing protein, partial [Bacteroidales bacterium]